MSAQRAKVNPSAKRSAKARQSRRLQVPAAYTPGDRYRKEAKALDAGLLAEHLVVDAYLVSRRFGIDAWRRPGIRIRRAYGARYMPDAAAYLEELAGLCVEAQPEVAGRPSYNAIIEVKSQTSGGSAHKKIEAAILDLAEVCDRRGVVGALILDAPNFTESRKQYLINLGRSNSVAVFDFDGLTRDQFVDELVRCAKERRRLYRRLGPRGGFQMTKRPSAAETTFSNRIRNRRATGAPVLLSPLSR